MTDLTDRMEQLRLQRLAHLADLKDSTTAMRLVAAEAHRSGLSAYRIAKLLGVTNRTVYLWLKR